MQTGIKLIPREAYCCQWILVVHVHKYMRYFIVSKSDRTDKKHININKIVCLYILKSLHDNHKLSFFIQSIFYLNLKSELISIFIPLFHLI